MRKVTFEAAPQSRRSWNAYVVELFLVESTDQEYRVGADLLLKVICLAVVVHLQCAQHTVPRQKFVLAEEMRYFLQLGSLNRNSIYL